MATSDDPMLNDRTPCTRAFFAMVLAPVVKAIGREMKNQRDKLRNDLEARITALEARPAMQYLGVWSAEKSYARGDLVTHGGSMFHCWEATTGTRATPGARPAETDSWQLCVKRGADAR